MNMHNAQNPHSSHLEKEDNNLCYVIEPFHEIFLLNPFHSFIVWHFQVHQNLHATLSKYKVHSSNFLSPFFPKKLQILCQLSQLYVHFLA